MLTLLEPPSPQSFAHVHEVEVPPPGPSHAISQLSDPPLVASPREVFLEQYPDAAESCERPQTRTEKSKKPWWSLPDRLPRKSHHPADPGPSSDPQTSASAASKSPSRMAEARRVKVGVLFFLVDNL